MSNVADKADPGEDRGESVNGARLIRFAEALDATVDELRSLEPGSVDIERIEAIVAQTVADAESVVPASLVPELHRLVAPIREVETERDLRVMLVELDGWIRGLLGSMGITFGVAKAEEGG